MEKTYELSVTFAADISVEGKGEWEPDRVLGKLTSYLDRKLQDLSTDGLDAEGTQQKPRKSLILEVKKPSPVQRIKLSRDGYVLTAGEPRRSWVEQES